MQLTKYEHACLDLNQQGRRLVIDPGVYSQSLQDLQNICAVVITHIHPDHYSPATIQKITKANPDVQIFTTKEVAKDLAALTTQAVSTEKQYSVGPFRLEFFGGQHASISPNYPAAQNYGVLVNDTLYYPGDSLVSCPKPHGTVALPIMALGSSLAKRLTF